MEFKLEVSSTGDKGARWMVHLIASTEMAAISQARARGLQVLSIETVDRAVKAALPGKRAFPVLGFCRDLLTLLDAGLNVHEACVTLASKEQDAGFHRTLQRLLDDLQKGRTLSDALEHSITAPGILIASIRATERSGDLAQALRRYIAYQSRLDQVREKIKAVSIYPAFLFVAGSLIALFLITFVVPKFSSVYEGSGRPLPLLSSYLVSLGKLLSTHPWVPMSFVIAFILGASWLVTQPGVRQRVIGLLLSLPYLASRVEVFRHAQFYRALGLLLHAGIPMSEAIRMAGGVLPSNQKASGDAARRAVEQGARLSTALDKAGLATAVALSLISVGEGSGRLADMLAQAADFHDEEFGHWIDIVSRLIEPVLMTVIGLVIGSVVVLMYLPIFDIAGALG
jgi:general secretion pathway protein F